MAKEKSFVGNKKEIKKEAMGFSGTMSKKLVMTVVAVLCSLSLLAVGVVSALTSFVVSIQNSFAVDINNVEGTLTASRTGGVYGLPVDGFEYDFEHNQGSPAQDFREVIYTTEDGVLSDYETLRNTKVNLTQENNVVEYQFKFTLDSNNYLNTKIELTYSDISARGVEATYEYVYSDQDKVSFEGASAVSNIVTMKNGEPIICDRTNPQVFVRAKLVLNNIEMNNNNVEIVDLLWNYKLSFTPTTETSSAQVVDNHFRIEFGKYPQSVVEDPQLVSSLEEYALVSSTEYVYASTGLSAINHYHIDSDKVSGKYNIGKQIFLACTYAGNEYVYVPKANLAGDYLLSNGYSVADGQSCWLKVEPIKWIILNDLTAAEFEAVQDGTYPEDLKLISQNVLLGLEFGQENQYESSDAKTFLNGTFSKQAFDSEEVQKIRNNDIELMSATDLQSYPAIKRAQASDFAVVNGISLATSTQKTVAWWTSSSTAENVVVVLQNGLIQTKSPQESGIGVRPFLTISVAELEVTFVNSLGDDQSIEIAKGSTIEDLPTPENLSNPSMVFAGWFEDSEFTTRFESDSKITESKTLHAKWIEQNSVRSVSFKMNDGTQNNAEMVAVYSGAVVSVIDTPQREGYKFAGWFEDSACETPYDFNSAVESDLLIYAKWEKLVSVKFNYGAGSNEYAEQYISAGENAKPFVLDSSINVGYEFAGWYEEKNGVLSDEMYLFDQSLSEDLTLVARWKVSVTYFTNHSGSDQGIYQTKTLLSGQVLGEVVSPTSSESNFVCWSESRNVAQEFDFETQINQNIELYAIWIEKPKYTVTFKNEDGTTLLILQNVKEGDFVEFSGVLDSQDSKNFAGWYFAPNAYSSSNRPINLAEYPITKDETFFANWTSYFYTVSLYYEFLVGEVPSNLISTMVVNGFMPIGELEIPVLEGFRFEGWLDKNGSEINPETYVPVNNCAIYAKWSQKQSATIEIFDDASRGQQSNKQTINVYVGDIIELQALTFDNGDVFKNYIDASGREYNAGAYEVEGDIQLFAVRNVKVRFERNYDDEDTEVREYLVKKGEKFAVSAPVYVRVGSKFVGWSLNRTGGQIIEDLTNYTFSESTTFYAIWE